MRTRILALLAGLTLCAAASAGEHDGKDCHTLALEIEALVAEQQRSAEGFFATPGTRVAAVATVVFEPAWFYLGYAAFRHLERSAAGSNILARLRALRAASADLRCYVS